MEWTLWAFGTTQTSIPIKEYKARRDTLRQYAQDTGLEVQEEDFYGMRQFTAAVAANSDNRCGYCCHLPHGTYRPILRRSARLHLLFVHPAGLPYQDRDLICTIGAKMGKNMR